MENNQPIIIKRVKRIAGGHHGGAWKIAMCDLTVHWQKEIDLRLPQVEAS